MGILTHFPLTKWPPFLKAFSGMKILEFRFKFHWKFFLKVQLTISQHWFRQWLGTEQVTSHYLNQSIHAALGVDVLYLFCLNYPYRVSIPDKYVNNSPLLLHGPLSLNVKWRVAHAPVTSSPPPTSELGIPACITARASRARHDAYWDR